MTASNPNRSPSDNSGSRLPVDAESIAVERDPRTTRIVEHINQNGPTTARDIASLTHWTLEETDTHLQRLRDGNYLQLIGEPESCIALLTERGEQLARGAL